jgi:hypothetical protein
MAMELIQVRLPKGLIEQVDEIVRSRNYASKSDVIRDALRRFVLDSMVGIIPNTGDSVKEVRAIRRMLSKMDPDLAGLKHV